MRRERDGAHALAPRADALRLEISQCQFDRLLAGTSPSGEIPPAIGAGLAGGRASGQFEVTRSRCALRRRPRLRAKPTPGSNRSSAMLAAVDSCRRHARDSKRCRPSPVASLSCPDMWPTLSFAQRSALRPTPNRILRHQRVRRQHPVPRREPDTLRIRANGLCDGLCGLSQWVPPATNLNFGVGIGGAI